MSDDEPQTDPAEKPDVDDSPPASDPAPEADRPAGAAASLATSDCDGGQDTRGLRKTRVGVVTSDGMAKTIVVDVVRRVPHPKFGKIIKRTTKIYAHDEKGEAKTGDRVRVIETRPLSKLKRWRLVEVLAH
ncbi:hypothetical protein BH23VER1_BH23VER1_17390 [soil metagenome]